jgi:hypothetical protein
MAVKKVASASVSVSAQGKAKKSMKKSHYKKKLALAAAAGIVGTAGWIAYFKGPAKKTTPAPRSKHVHFAPTTRKTLFHNISDWWYGASKSSKSKL